MADTQSYAPDADFNKLLSGIGDPTERGLLSKINQNESEEKEYAKGKEKEIEAIKSPDRPPMPIAPKQQDYQTDPMQTFGSAGMMIATLGSLLTRAPLSNALKGAAGVMNAVNTKDTQSFKNAYEKWKTDTDYAFKLAEWDQNGFKDALSKGELEAKYHAISTKNDAALTALQMKMQDNYLRDQEKARKQGQNGYDSIKQYADDAYNNAKDAGKSEDEAIMAQMKAFGEAKNALNGKNGPASTIDWDKLKPEDIIPGTNMTYRVAKEKAEQYSVDPTVLSRGGVPIADKNAIMDLKAKMDKDAGLTGRDITASQAGAKADTSSLTKMQYQLDSASAYEDTMSANMDIVKNLMDKGAGTEEGPVINRWIQAGRRATGDPDVSAFDTAIQTVVTEAAKIQSGSIGNQALTDSARNEALAQINKYDSPKAILSSFDVLKKDAENKKTNYGKEIGIIKDRITGKSSNSLKTYSSSEYKKAIADKTLKSGDSFLDSNGVEHKVD